MLVGTAGIKALEVHREGREHGQGRHQEPGEEMVGHLPGRVSGLGQDHPRQ